MPIFEYIKKRILENKPNFTYLDLSGDCGIGLFKNDVDELVELLRQNHYITRVNLYRNVINNDGARKLATLTRIKEFNLSANNIDDDGIVELLSNPNIERLELSCCRGLTNKCVELIIKYSQQKDILLSDTNIDDELKWKAYNHIKRKNEQLSELQLKRMLLPSVDIDAKRPKVQPAENGNKHNNEVTNSPINGKKTPKV